MSLAQIFGDTKPLIGMVHLRPLPGSPRYDGNLEAVAAEALHDVQTLQSGGMDGCIIENFGDAPFYPDRVPAVTVAAMTWVIARIRPKIRFPFGVNVLRNDVRSAISIAAVTGAGFVRVNVHIGAALTDQGIIEGQACESLRLRSALRCDALILADVAVKHSEAIGGRRPLEFEACEAVERGLADAIVLTGSATGEAGAPWDIRSVKAEVPRVPVLAGSGVLPETVQEFLEVADGIIVGSALEAAGKAGRPVELARVKRFVQGAGRAKPGGKKATAKAGTKDGGGAT